MAALLALATVPIVLHRERRRRRRRRRRARSGSAPGSTSSGGRRWACWLAILVVYKGGEALAYGMVKPLLVDRGLSIEDIGWLHRHGRLPRRARSAPCSAACWSTGPAAAAAALLVAGALQVAGILAYVAPAAGIGGVAGARGGQHARAPHRRHRHRLALHRDDGRLRRGGRHRLHPPGERGGDRHRRRGHASGFVAQRLGYPLHFAAGAALSALGLAFTWRVAKTPPSPPPPPA